MGRAHHDYVESLESDGPESGYGAVRKRWTCFVIPNRMREIDKYLRSTWPVWESIKMTVIKLHSIKGFHITRFVAHN